MFHMRMGDPTTPEGKKQLERQSPLFSAEKIKTPLLVVQGANDPRVKKAESDQIVIALRDRKLSRRIHRRAGRGARLRASGEQHGDVCGHREVPVEAPRGRASRSPMTPDVAKRLKEITVDPKTVTLTKPSSPSAVKAPDAGAAARRSDPPPTPCRSRSVVSR